jgi:hypothetical protein
MRVRLVILEFDVVPGFMLFDERRFKDQRFHVAVSDDEFEVGDLSYESVGLSIEWSGRPKVRTYTTAEVFCLADIDHLSRRVFV